MTPQARAEAAIELLDMVIAGASGGGAAADTLIARYFKTRRYAGVRDRRAVRELVYAAIRRAGAAPASGRAALIGLAADDPAIAALFDGGPHAPAPIVPDEARAAAGLAPAWLEDKLAAALGPEALPALLARAPLDLRVNRLRATRAEVLSALPGSSATPLAEFGVRLAEPIAIEATPLWRDGLIEVQDEGSQLVAAACRATAGMTVVDLCAGAGGKTLALAAAMGGDGRLIACDTDRGRLSRLAPRAARAGVAVETRLLDPERELERLDDLRGTADVVLVDAPCSGTGTWRRNPEARWRLTPARLDRLMTLQRRLIAVAATMAKPGGALVYAVCSLLPEEGAEAVATWLAANAGWTATAPFEAGLAVGPGRRLDPARDGTDGFFVARLERAC